MNLTYQAPNGATFVVRPASPTADLLDRRLKSGLYRLEDGELMKRCSHCRDYWPADTEFFYTKKGGDGLGEWCKACYQEWRYPNGRNETPTQQEGVAA